jgi:hypothetical protein
MALDLSEISGLADPARHVRRCTESSLIYLEVLVMGMCGIIPWMVQLAHSGVFFPPECNYSPPTPECDEQERINREVDPYVMLAWILPACLVYVWLCHRATNGADRRQRSPSRFCDRCMCRLLQEAKAAPPGAPAHVVPIVGKSCGVTFQVGQELVCICISGIFTDDDVSVVSIGVVADLSERLSVSDQQP